LHFVLPFVLLTLFPLLDMSLGFCVDVHVLFSFEA